MFILLSFSTRKAVASYQTPSSFALSYGYRAKLSKARESGTRLQSGGRHKLLRCSRFEQQDLALASDELSESRYRPKLDP